jgi:hypothetical protein
MSGALSGERTLSFTLLLALARAVIRGSESTGTRDHILLSQIWDFHFVAFYDSKGYGGGIWPRLHTGSNWVRVRVRVSYFTTGGLPPISSSWRRAPWNSRPEFFLNWTPAVIVLTLHPLWQEDGYNCCWSSPAHSFSGPSRVGLAATFYYIRLEASLFVASYDSRGYGGGIRPRLQSLSGSPQLSSL